ncbi:hypothetical protein [Flavobacterium sp.]|uniref:hypothetical protein n=1 Tax=Flavobacterium sp. TaxID=239 RepID=UPI00286A815A|nr:hypothetical protein [Flavobacterium sp.]
MTNLFKITILIVLVLFQISCKPVQDISPKQGTITVPAKGKIKMWNDLEHASFSLKLENTSTKNSCEAYKVKKGNQKWISPSLLANKSLEFSIATNGYLVLQNYSDEVITVKYTIN